MRTRMAICLSCVLLVAIFSSIFVGRRAQADVQHGIPPGPNEANWKFCGGSGFIDFEGMAEGQPLGEVIPGVKFITTNGQDWLVGRWSSGNYNGKYPSGNYTSEGDAWAWLGPNQGAGVIRFTQGKASYFSCIVSTASGVGVDAYDEHDNLIESSGFATNNTNTGTMDKLIIDRPTADIQYVIVHDTGNYWLLDSICTNAPGVGCGVLDVPSYKQYDAQWNMPGTNYDHTSSKISELGCGLTSLVMVLRSYGITNVNGQDVNPVTLNDWLNAHDGYVTTGVNLGNIRWEKIDTFSGNHLKYEPKSVLCDSNAASLYGSVVDQAIFEQRPVILRVQNGEKQCGHFVVATGKCGSTYKLRDPGHPNVNQLSDPPFNNHWYGYRLYVPSDGVPRPAVVINIYSPADVLVTDPNGRRSGIDPATGQVFDEIPGSSYSDEGGIEDDENPGFHTDFYRSLHLSAPVDGNYQINVTGTGSGPYDLEVVARDSSDSYTLQQLLGVTRPGTVDQYSLAFSRTQSDGTSISSPGSIKGGGNFGVNARNAVVNMNIVSDGSIISGNFHFNTVSSSHLNVHSTSIRTAAFHHGIANVNGTCSVNNSPGYEFNVVVNTTSGPSTTVDVQIKRPDGTVVFSNGGTLRGNFKVTPP
jgi:hypothetical protein